MCELLFEFDELSNANKGHIRMSRCSCVNGREAHLENKDIIQRTMRHDSVILNSSVKVHVFKWPVRKAGFELE